MTIALPDRSVRSRRVVSYVSDRNPYEPDRPYVGVWDSFDLKRHFVADVVPTAMTAAEIEALVAEVHLADITPSDNDTTYIEWETAEGFASLEVGYTRFAFTFLPNSTSIQERYGQSGALTDRSRITSLIRKHS
ncbi:hypothetical protein [Microbacterium oxydans]|uniref:Uncharacterized protein n=1 Tax=Microbacterium oxydans TaxID=82380 RepID=A0A0F0LC30_9MICO|nr:hypothetical protein [Microbacterium oxydans]KJL30229.1 hypothetical protein RS83_00979 [Microbacterium oxydans]